MEPTIDSKGRFLPNNIWRVLERLIICEPTTLTTGCWIWPGHKRKDGYGMCKLEGKRHTRVHRAVYLHFVGPIPEGLVLDHLCRNRDCANFEHLEPVTDAENFARAPKPEPKTHCPQGHPYSGYNLIVNKDGSKACRKCVNIRTLAYMRRKFVPKPKPTHCPKGHPYEGDNLRVYRGARICVMCSKARSLRWSHKNRSAQDPCCRQGHPLVEAGQGVDGRRHRYCPVCLSNAGKKGGYPFRKADQDP